MESPAVAPTSPRRAPAIATIVTGAVLALLAFSLMAGGGLLAWASSAKTDDNGWWSTGEHRYTTSTRAFATQDLDIGAGGPRWVFDSGHLASVRVSARSAGQDVFVGIAPTRKVQAYLSGVAHDELTDLELDPFDPRFDRRPGGLNRLAAPTSQGFWTASASGAGRQTVSWPVRRGRWSVVVMNADASPGVSVALAAGARVPFVHDLGVGMLVAGTIVGLGGGALMILGGASLRRRVGPPATSAPQAAVAA